MPKINVDSNYRHHPKVQRLKTYCGNEADIFPIRLWLFCAEYFPKDGILKGYTDSEIEGILGWGGISGNLIYALSQVGFLEKVGESYAIHDWKQHAGFIWNYSRAGSIAGKKSGESRRLKIKTVERIVNDRSTIELNGIELNNTTAPTGASPSGEGAGNLEDIRKTIKAWKVLNGLPTEGLESSAWDKAHFARLAKTAKTLLNLLGSPQEAVKCMNHVMTWCEKNKLNFAFETVLKRSDLYLEVRNNGKLVE